MKTSALRNLTQEELVQKEKSLKEELFKLNAQRYMAQPEKPHMFSLIKKEIARIKTIVNEKKKEKAHG